MLRMNSTQSGIQLILSDFVVSTWFYDLQWTTHKSQWMWRESCHAVFCKVFHQPCWNRYFSGGMIFSNEKIFVEQCALVISWGLKISKTTPAHQKIIVTWMEIKTGLSDLGKANISLIFQPNFYPLDPGAWLPGTYCVVRLRLAAEELFKYKQTTIWLLQIVARSRIVLAFV